MVSNGWMCKSPFNLAQQWVVACLYHFKIMLAAQNGVQYLKILTTLECGSYGPDSWSWLIEAKVDFVDQVTFWQSLLLFDYLISLTAFYVFSIVECQPHRIDCSYCDWTETLPLFWHEMQLNVSLIDFTIWTTGLTGLYNRYDCLNKQLALVDHKSHVSDCLQKML